MNLHNDTKIQRSPVTSKTSFKKAVLLHREKMVWIIFISSLNFSQVSTQRTDGASEHGEL